MIRLKKNNACIPGAPTIMRERGKKTDRTVLERIKEKPGTTIHEIAEYLNWTNGRVDGSVNRLVEQGKVRIDLFLRRRTLVKRVYPAEEIGKPPNVLEIEKEAIDKELWKDKVFIYSLSRSSIGLSPTKIDEWENRAFWKTQVNVEDDSNSLFVKLPEKLSNFYRLENSEITLSINDDFVIATIETTIVPIEPPPLQPKIPISSGTRHFMVIAKVIEVVDTSEVESYYKATSLGEDMKIPGVTPSKHEINILCLGDEEKRDTATSQEVKVPVKAVIT